MFICRIIVLFSCAFFAQQTPALSSDELLSPEQAFNISARAVSADEIVISWDIAEGYYLYRNKLNFEAQSEAVQLGDPDLPTGKIKQDPLFGKVAIYRNKLKILVPLIFDKPASLLKLSVKYQGCADIGICYPPQQTHFDIDLPDQKSTVQIDPVNKLVQSFQGLKLNLFEEKELLPPDQAFQFFASVKNDNTLRVNWIIAEGYYLYREKVELAFINTQNLRMDSYTVPRGIPKHDEAFGQVEIFHHELSFDVPIVRSDLAAQIATLEAKFQGCADRGVCYPPMLKNVALELPEIQQLPAATNYRAPAKTVLSEQDQVASSLHQDTMLLTLISFFGFGLLLSFTPCVFPMIPILSGIIIGHGESITTTRAFLLSLSFVLATAITYTAFGVLAALFGSNLQATFQEPWIIILFSSIFVLLALSMFGFYDLEMPKAIQSRLHNSSDHYRNGSLWGAAFMGVFSSLIVGPCVAAPLAGALIYIGQTGDAVLGGSALFMMGLGMGAPLLLVGISAGKFLPKAGQWLNSTKSIFGVIMLAVAVWMLERILPTPIAMLLWAMLLIIPAIYLRALDPLPENSSGWSKLWKGMGLTMLSYGVLLLIGFSIGNSNPLKPLQGFGINNSVKHQEIPFQRVVSLADLENRLQQASINRQWVMLDFYADWCISCKEMEAYTFSDPQVQQQLSKVILLQADVTGNTSADNALLKHFSLVGPPGIIFFDRNQRERPELRIIGFQNAETFAAKLRQVII